MNLLGEKSVRLLFGVGGVEARVESLDLDDGMTGEPEFVDRFAHDEPKETQ